MDNDWSRLVFSEYSPVEGQDGSGISGTPMIRPGSEVELSHFQWTLRTSLELYTITITMYV